eukprot:jgi/Orpsp1_1/1175614/evm.model.c7180000054534.1
MYDSNIISKICIYENKLVSLPISLDINVLYSNIELLNKYKKRAPKTWNELIETNNELGTCSIYEFIYSCRNSKDSDFPEIISNETENALKLMKHVKEELDIDSPFQYSNFNSVTNLYDKKTIFSKFWNRPYFSFYSKSILPGLKEGISGSTIGGYNIGINKYIKNENIIGALDILKFMTSRDIQRKIVVEMKSYSAITSLYNEEEVCKVIDCELYKNIQHISRPTSNYYDYNLYSMKFRNYIYEFLFGNKEASKVLKNIDDITKIYYIPISKESNIGFTFIIIICFLSFIMYLSLILIFLEKIKLYYQYFSKILWIISITGSLMLLCLCLTEYEKRTLLKCKLKLILFSFGILFQLIPYLFKLAENTPKGNYFSNQIIKHKYLFLFCLLFINLIFCIFAYISSYNIKEIKSVDEKKYQICTLNKYGIIILCIILLFYSIIIIFILIFSYLKRNNENTKNEIRFIIFSVYANILFLLNIIIQNSIKYDNLTIYFLLHELSYILLSLSNYLILFIIRPIWIITRKEDEELKIIEIIKNQFLSSTITDTNNTNNTFYSSETNSNFKN